MSMKKEFVIYNQALRLKTLGFDEPCFGYYSKGELIHNSHTNNYMQRFRYSAPTFSQAFRWFRDKYLLDSWIYCSDENKGYFAIIVSCKRLVFYNENKNTYEEAESACLDKLIEIVESKTE